MRTYFRQSLRREWDTRRWLFGVVLALELAVLVPAATYVIVIPGEEASGDSVRPVATTQADQTNGEPLPTGAEPAVSEPVELELQVSPSAEDATAPTGEGESSGDEPAPEPQNAVPDFGGVSTQAPGSRELESITVTSPQPTGPRETDSGDDSPPIVGTPGQKGEERGG